MLSFLSGFNQKYVTMFWHKPLLFSIVRAQEQGPFPGHKGVSCFWSPLRPSAMEALLRGPGMLVDQNSLTRKLKSLHRPRDLREASKPGEQSNKDALMKKAQRWLQKWEHLWWTRLTWWIQLGLIFARMTRRDFDSWTAELTTERKSCIGGISHLHTYSRLASGHQ